MSIQIRSNFDSGNIIVNDITNNNCINLSPRNDTNSHFAQWFYFQLYNIQNKPIIINLTNLDKTAYPDGWLDYNVCTSFDNSNWFRTKSIFTTNTLSWVINCTYNSVYFAYFEPYSYAKHLDLIAKTRCKPNVKHQIVGLTTQQRPIDLLMIGNSNAKYKVWVIARQHPGEAMAEYFCEGVIDKLTSLDDPHIAGALENFVFYIVPNMNPDGTFLGNLRTNSNGINLNRQWDNPSIAQSPEVYYIKEKILTTGVDLFFDIHGDESIPYVFTAGCQNNPSFSSYQAQLNKCFDQIFLKNNSDYQTKFGYTDNQFGSEAITMATNWVGNEFDCLALTLEMPFKDNANSPDQVYGWSAKRSYLLGQSLVNSCILISPKLRK